jgi:hypothetical protein
METAVHRSEAPHSDRSLRPSDSHDTGAHEHAAGADGGRGISQIWVEAILAAAAFAALCLAVLSVAPQAAEPDDGAYRASIVAMTDGHFLTLSAAQAEAVARQLDDNPAAPPNQWVELANGRYISEKDPGYPFLAAPFQELGIPRWAPLCYGALACLGLFAGARRWLGRFGGFAAVGLYCSSGAALAFGWRGYMPTFTDASLVAAGTGALLWAILAAEARPRRRTWTASPGSRRSRSPSSSATPTS